MKENIIVKKNEFLKFGYTLSLMEQRLLLACISQIDSRSCLDMNKQFVVTVQEIQDLFSLDACNQMYGHLKTACNRLWGREIVTRDTKTTTRLRWVWKVVYSDSEGLIKLNFSPDVIPYLSAITERFTKYKLKDVAEFKCIYSLRIYELFAQYQGVGFVSYDIDDLRALLDLNKKYLLYSEFRRNVIEKSVAEINNFSNLTVSYSEKRMGRKVIALLFHFKTKSVVITPSTETIAKSKSTTSLNRQQQNNGEELNNLVEEIAIARKRFGVAVNENNVPCEVIEILKKEGRW
jgi:plasmid replication initiation protein